MQEMSLHRVIAEIKAIENWFYNSPPDIVLAVSKKDGVAGMTDEQFKAKSQANVDKVQSELSRLVKLKVARNIANSIHQVTVSGNLMTIDEAIIRKATIPKLQGFIENVKRQYHVANQAVATASAEVEKKIEAQAIAIGGSTKKVSEDELNTIRTMLERSTGKKLLMGTNVVSFIEKAEDEINKFLVEVDFALSEANAKTVVQVGV